MHFKRYPIESSLLKPWVQFIWHFKTDIPVSVNNKLLPTDSIDIIINRENRIRYIIEDRLLEADDIHFFGMRNVPRTILQEGILNVFGISFFPYGLYPFLKLPLSLFTEGISNLKEFNPPLEEKLAEAAAFDGSIENIVLRLEQALESALNLKGLNLTHIQLLQEFCQSNYETPILKFCQEHKVNVKTFERACLKYTGYTPKALQRIRRFQETSNQLIFNGGTDTFVDLAYMYDYYDQAHFIREFQNHSGVSPATFIKEQCTVKENSTLL